MINEESKRKEALPIVKSIVGNETLFDFTDNPISFFSQIQFAAKILSRKKEPDSQMLELISEFNSFLMQGTENENFEIFIKNKLLEHGFYLGDKKRFLITIVFENIALFKFLGNTNKKNTNFYRRLSSSILHVANNLDGFLNLMRMSREDLENMTKGVIHSRGNQITLEISPSIYEGIKLDWDQSNEGIPEIMNFFGLEEQEAREEAADFLEIFRDQISEIGRFVPKQINGVYEILLSETKKKRPVFSFIHESLCPYIASWHSEQEFKHKRDKIPNVFDDDQAFKQHQRNVVLAMVNKVKTNKKK